MLAMSDESVTVETTAPEDESPLVWLIVLDEVKSDIPDDV